MPNALVVTAHPEPTSFSAALAARARHQLTSQGYEVTVSDLYALGWHPSLGPDEFANPANTDRFDPSAEQEHAFHAGGYAPDVQAEQQKVADADLIILHFPIWWFSAPAILKGWFDRVFARGFAYSRGKKYSRGHFLGKRAMLCVTTGTAGTLYEPNGIDGDLHHVLWPIQNGLLAYCGFTVLPPFAAFAPGVMSEEERRGTLATYAERLAQLDEIEPLFFHPLEDYDRTQRLLPGVEARSGVQWNPRAGQTFADAASRYTPRTRDIAEPKAT